MNTFPILVGWISLRLYVSALKKNNIYIYLYVEIYNRNISDFCAQSYDLNSSVKIMQLKYAPYNPYTLHKWVCPKIWHQKKSVLLSLF